MSVGRPRGRMPEKRVAIAQAARAVFARDGYARASVDAIAAEAGVSKRTIYNHYADKEQLFRSVILDSSQQVVAAHTRTIQRHLGEIADLPDALRAFGREWATPMEEFSGHFALVRQIQAEVAHVPRDVLEAWQNTGPRAARHLLAERLRELADQEVLRIDDAETAAEHLLQLVVGPVGQRTLNGALPIDDTEADQLIDSGVRAFLKIYGR